MAVHVASFKTRLERAYGFSAGNHIDINRFYFNLRHYTSAMAAATTLRGVLGFGPPGANAIVGAEWQGLTLVHLSAPCKRFLRDSGYIQGLFWACLWCISG
jgi:hypothetical protein